MPFLRLLLSALALSFLGSTATAAATTADYNVRDYGATGDGHTLDTDAINRAIAAASAAGGGRVRFPAGSYLSFSIRLKSHIELRLDAGSTLVAATPAAGFGRYDAAEPNPSASYQDFGHSHWRNSLIWGDGLENIALTGPGLIDGRGLVRHGPPPAGRASASSSEHPSRLRSMDGQGNKAIGLKLCRNVVIRDLSIRNAGHFAVLATGVDNLTLANLKVDTNRDGFDIDCCRNVRISNCSVNTPNDDAIVLKSSFALNTARDTENVTIANCFVSGFDPGTMLDGTFGRTQAHAPDRDGPTGRIKLGTESSGGFRNIVITGCVFERSRGLAIESVDGGVIEDVIATNLVMRDIVNAPIFIRLGDRGRSPAGTPVGAIRRIAISHVSIAGADARYPILLAGLAGHPIEDVTVSDLHLVSRGGFTLAQVAQQPAGIVNPFFLRHAEPGAVGPREPFAVPERASAYPEPSMFGLLPASALYARHVSHLTVRDITVGFAAPDERPVVVLDDVTGAIFENVRAPRPPGGDFFVLRHTKDFETLRTHGVPDTHLATATASSL
jgi:polygalacturonase